MLDRVIMVPQETRCLGIWIVVVLELPRCNYIFRPAIPWGTLYQSCQLDGVLQQLASRSRQTAWVWTHRIRSMQMNGTIHSCVVDKAHHGLASLFYNECRTGGHSIVSNEVCITLGGVDILSEGSNIDLVVIDWVACHRVRNSPNNRLSTEYTKTELICWQSSHMDAVLTGGIGSGNW